MILEANESFSFEKKECHGCSQCKSTGMGNADVETTIGITHSKIRQKMDANE